LPAKRQKALIALSVKALGLFVLAVLAAGFLAAAKPVQQTAKDTETCGQCHEEVVKGFAQKPHAAIGAASCTSCHTGSEKHIQEGGGANIFAFKPADPSAQKAANCLKCHADKGGPFLYEHGSSRVEGCAVCHDSHGSPNRHMLTSQSTADLCFSCHTVAPQWHKNFSEKTTNFTSCHSTIHGSDLSKIFLK
jgi:predicted CXXCH cytochrome family protein